MAEEEDNSTNIPGVSLDLSPDLSPAGSYVEDEEQQSLTAFGELLRYDTNRKKVLDAGRAVGETIDLTFKNATPVLPMQSESSDDVDMAEYRRRMAPAEAEKQNIPFAIGNSAGGVGTSLTMIGEAFNQAGMKEFGGFLGEKGKEITANAPKHTFSDVRQVKSIGDVIKFVWEYGTEAAGSSAPFMVAGVLGGPTGAALVGNAMGQGQVRQSLLDEYNNYYDIADQFDRNGDTQKARVLRGFADQLHPDKHRELVARIGTVIGALDAGSAYITLFRGAPEGLVDAVKKRLYKKVAEKILMRVLEGAGSESVTEASQDYMADLAVIEAKGMTSWLASVDQLEKDKWKYINSAAAGAAGGGLMSVAHSTMEVGKGAFAPNEDGIRGSGPEIGKSIPPVINDEAPQAPAAPQAPQPLPKEEAPEPVQMDDGTRSKLKAYLANPQNMVRKKDYESIGEILGVPASKVPGILESAAQEGIIRKDQRGIFRRLPPQPLIVPETGEAAGTEFIAPEPQPVPDPTPETPSVEDAPQAPPTEAATVEPENEPAGADGVRPAEVPTVAEPIAAPDEPARVQAPREKQIAGLEIEIEADTQNVAEIVAKIRTAPKKEAPALRAQAAEVNQRIKANKARLQALENGEAATPAPAPVESQPTALPEAPTATAPQPVSTPQKAPKGPRKGTPEGGLSLIGYLVKSGGVIVPKSQKDFKAENGPARKARTRARAMFGNDLPPALFGADTNQNARNLDDPALWDDLVEEGYIPPYQDPNGGPNLYDPYEVIVNKISDGIGGQHHYSDKFDKTTAVNRDEEEYQVTSKLRELLSGIGVEYDLTPVEEARLYQLVLDQNYAVDDAFEQITREVYDGQIDSSPEQSSVDQDQEGEGDNAGREGEGEGSGSEDVRPGEAGNEGTGTLRAEDVIPFAIYRQQQANEARAIGQRIELAFRKALGLTEEQKAERLFKKVSTLTGRNGEPVKLVWFNESFEGIPAADRPLLLDTVGPSGEMPYALALPNSGAIALSLFATSEGVSSRALLTHEVLHKLVDIGVVTQEELNQLADRAIAEGIWKKEHDRYYRVTYRHVAQKYGATVVDNLIREEAACALVQTYAEGRIKVEKEMGLLREIIERILEVLDSFRAAFKEEKITWEDVLSSLIGAKVGNGEMGRYVTHSRLTFAAGKIRETIEDTEQARLARRQLDELGYYSALLEKAQSLPQEKGTGEQFAKMLEKGTKAAERQMTGLDGFLQSKPTFTKQEIVDYLTQNRVKLLESRNRQDPEFQRKVEKLGAKNAEVKEAIRAKLREHNAIPNTFFNRSKRKALMDDIEKLSNELDGLQAQLTNIYFDNEKNTKFHHYSLDPMNTTYGETILHLPLPDATMSFDEWYGLYGNEYNSREDARSFYNDLLEQQIPLSRKAINAYHSGHFPQPNIIGHMMHSLTYYAGKPVFLVDQIQSDWGQALRKQKGTPEESRKRLEKLQEEVDQLRKGNSREARLIRAAEEAARKAGVDPVHVDNAIDAGMLFSGAGILHSDYYGFEDDLRKVLREDLVPGLGYAMDKTQRMYEALGRTSYTGQNYDEAMQAWDDARLEESQVYNRWISEEDQTLSLKMAELNQLSWELGRMIEGNPLVNNTDQWVTTTLRRALRMAVEAGSDYIAIPSGNTVLSYNPGKTEGMQEFYGAADKVGIVPKNLRNLFTAMGADTLPFRVDTLDSPSGKKGLGKGFTLFEIPASIKRKVVAEGQPLFAINKIAAEMAAEPAPVVGEKKKTLSIPGLKKPMSPAEAAEALRAEREGKAKLLGPFAPRPELADWMGLPLAPFQADIEHIYNKRATKDQQFQKWMKPITSKEEVRATIEQVLDNAQFAFKYKRDDNWNLVYRTDEYDHIVSIAPKVSGYAGAGPQFLTIPTAFIVKRGNKDEAIITSLQEGGLENLRWRKGVTEIDRLLHIVRQARGPGEHPSIGQAIKKLQEEQLLLKGVRSEILFALAAGQNQKIIKGINTITRELADGLGVTLRQGYGPQWGYKSRAGVIRQKAYYDFSQLAQNLAPLLEQRHNWLFPLIANHSAELGAMAQTLDPQDGWHEFMELYFVDPAAAQQRAPGFYNDFEDEMEFANPAHLAVMQTTQLALQEYFAANPIESVESMVTPAERTTRMTRLAKEIERDGTFATIKHGLLYVYSQTIGSDQPLKSAVRRLLEMRLEKTGSKLWLKAIENPAKLFRMIPQAQSVATMDIKEGIQMRDGTVRGPGLPEVLRTALGSDKTTALDLTDGSPYSHFLSYIVALRAKQLWERRMAGDLERNPTVVPYATVVKAISDLEAQYPDFAVAQKKLNDFTRALLKLKLDAGLIDYKTYAELDKDQFYVPFQRSFDEEVSVAFQGSSGVSVEHIMKKLRGSNRDIIDPIAMLAKDVYSTRQMIAINDTIASLLKLAETVGPEGGKIAERIKSKQAEGTNILVEEAVRQAAKAAGLSKADTQNLISSVAAEVGSDALATAFKQVAIKPGGQPIALFMEGGQLQAVSINDPVLGKMIFDSLQLFGQQSSFLIEAASMPAQIERFTITTNPAFVLANAIRDSLHAPGYERKMIPIVSQVSGAIRIFRGDPLLNEYIRAGGIMGGIGAHGMDQRRLDDGIKKLIGLGYEVNTYTGVADFVREWQTRIETTETMTRIELYRIAKNRALKQGLSEIEAQREAAFYANDYCDYSRNGIKSNAIRKMIAFWNASIQGVDRFRKTVSGSEDYGSVFKPYMKYLMGKGPNLTPGEWNALNQSAAAFFYWFFVIGSISALVWSYNNDDDRLRDIPDEIKATHWVIPLGGVINLIGKETWLGRQLDELGGKDDLARIPKPFESAWLANLIERFLWDQQKGDPNWGVKWARDVYDTTLPPLEPAWLKLYGIGRYGKDPLTGKDIETPAMKKLDPRDRFTPFTSEFSKWLGDQVNSSPVHIDAALKALGTSWARDLLSLNIPGTPWYNSNKPYLGLDEYVMARRFLWQVGKQSEAGRIVREMMGQEDIISGVFQRLSVPYSKLASSAQTYSSRLKTSSLDSANRYLSERTPRERGFAILLAGLEGRSSKYEKLDPVLRASEIGEITWNLQQELTKGVLVIEKGTKKEKRQGANAITQRRARDILVQLQAQEHHNALVLTKEPGYAERVMFDTSGLYEELKQADPDVYGEMTRRMSKAHVMPWKGIQAVWPELQKRLESDELYREAQTGKPQAVEGKIRDLWFKAKYPGG